MFFTPCAGVLLDLLLHLQRYVAACIGTTDAPIAAARRVR
jgi:hypothetical protein